MAVAEALLFGPLAQELGARALSHPPDLDRSLGTRVGVTFVGSALRADERELLARLPSAVLGRFPEGGAGSEGEDWLACDPAELASAAAQSSAAACFLAAVEERARPPGPPRFMGVVNVTPDSFSDGGRFLDPARAIEHGLSLEAEGADLLDIGGESTRPGARAVELEEELRRVLPVVDALARSCRVPISVDTSKAAVARAALDRGAALVNDVTAGRGDAEMLPLVAKRRCDLVLMHMRGTPADMQRDPRYGDPVAEVARFLRERVAACLRAGIELQRMVLDPGIGFGKRVEHNLDLLRRLSELRSLGRPLCLGVSRKSFIAEVAGRLRTARSGEPGDALDRSGGTAAALVSCLQGGAEILRVHEVARGIEAAAVALAIAARSSLPPHAERRSPSPLHLAGPCTPI